MKRIVVHAGLSKTGTSAVQRWLDSERDALSESGVYYPGHRSNEIGISSGNWQALLERKAGALKASPDAISATLDDFAAREETTLLISSEFLSDHIKELSKLLPNETRFIVYVRDPIEARESTYNQRVKRHGQTDEFRTGDVKKAGPALVPFLESVPGLLSGGIDLVLRPYHPQLFVGNSLLDDLFDAASLQVPQKNVTPFGTSSPLNTSYTLNALEFKRAANRLPLRDAKIMVSLDLALQQCELGPKDYSLISPEDLPRLRDIADAELKALEDDHGVYSLSGLRAQVIQDSGRPHRKQRISDAEIVAVAEYLREGYPDLFASLQLLVKALPGVSFPYPAFRRALS